MDLLCWRKQKCLPGALQLREGMDTTIERRGGNSLVSVSGGIAIESSPDLRMLLLKS